MAAIQKDTFFVIQEMLCIFPHNFPSMLFSTQQERNFAAQFETNTNPENWLEWKNFSRKYRVNIFSWFTIYHFLLWQAIIELIIRSRNKMGQMKVLTFFFNQSPCNVNIFEISSQIVVYRECSTYEVFLTVFLGVLRKGGWYGWSRKYKTLWNFAGVVLLAW